MNTIILTTQCILLPIVPNSEGISIAGISVTKL